MQHTLFEYSKDPEKFSLDNFLVIEDYQYDVNKLNKLFTKNDILYKNGKLIVQSDEMKNKLFSFLKIQLLNDKPGVMKYKDRLFLRNFYKRPTDFRQEPKQNIFIGFSILKDSIVQKNSKFGIKCSLMPKLREPYFYKNYNISNYTIFLVQNTDDGSLNKALGLCVEWQNKHINIGYNSSIVVDPSSVNYEIYSESGLIKRAKQYTKSHFTVIRFENKYSALLPIE